MVCFVMDRLAEEGIRGIQLVTGPASGEGEDIEPAREKKYIAREVPMAKDIEVIDADGHITEEDSQLKEFLCNRKDLSPDAKKWLMAETAKKLYKLNGN